ncbi:MAG: hypothetical protein ACK5LL_00350 [Suipraeoptans sp.]
MDNKTNSELIALVRDQEKQIGDLREEIGRLKALLEVSNHQRRNIGEDNPNKTT